MSQHFLSDISQTQKGNLVVLKSKNWQNNPMRTAVTIGGVLTGKWREEPSGATEMFFYL